MPLDLEKIMAKSKAMQEELDASRKARVGRAKPEPEDEEWEWEDDEEE